MAQGIASTDYRSGRFALDGLVRFFQSAKNCLRDFPGLFQACLGEAGWSALVKIFDQHQVTAALIQAGAKKPTVIGRDRKPRPFHNQFTIHGKYRGDLLIGKIEKLNIRAATARGGVEEVKALRRQRPVALRRTFEHAAFCAACDGNAPDAGAGVVYVVKDELCVERFKGFASAVAGELHDGTAFQRRFPHLSIP